MFVAYPVLFAALTPCSTAATIWQRGGRLGLTVVVKATYRFAVDGVATPTEPVPIVERDAHREKSPTQSVDAPSDLAPYLPQAGVVLKGHACAGAKPQPSMSVRLMVVRDAVLLDKVLHVYGDRAGGAASPPAPFPHLPIIYERALGGAAQPDNPVGRDGRIDVPNVVDPSDPSAVAGYGPIGWDWPSRQRLLGSHDMRRLNARIPDYPDTFDWSYFHFAPADQRIDYLRGDEQIVLQGLVPDHASLTTQLPSARAEARVVRMTSAGVAAPETIALRADSLLIDAERMQMSVVWRGDRALAIGEEALTTIGVLAGVSSAEQTIAWPADGDAGPLRGELSARLRALPPEVAAPGGTVLGRGGITSLTSAGSPAAAPAAPFAVPPPASAPGPAPVLAPPAAVGPAPVTSAAPAGAAPPPTASVARADASFTPPQPPGPQPPRRDGDDLPFVTRAHFDVATLAWQLEPPQDALVVIVKGTYDLVPGGAATPVEVTEFCQGDRHFGDDPEASAIYPSDLALHKPMAEVLMVGHAHAPSEGATVSKVRFKFGTDERGFDRTVFVYGDRTWKRGLGAARPSDPAPFERIPLVHEYAFGGPGFATNPCGRGHGESEALPNLELPDAPVTSPHDTLAPACFAPIALTWEERWAKLGTYDKTWFRTRWPYYPTDFDWSHFQSAPPSQRLEWLAGDEAFIVEGVHPELETIEGRLPGARARAFAVGRGGTRDDFREVELALDTVTFDFDAMTVNLVWRGSLPVSADDAPELQTIFALNESLRDQPRSVDQAFAAYLDAITPKPPVPQEPDDEPADDPPEDEESDPELEAAEAKATKMHEEAEKRMEEALAEAGLDAPDLQGPPPPPNPDDIVAALRASGATQGEIESVLSAFEPEAPEAAPDAPEPELPLRDRVVAMLEAGESFAGFDFEGGDFSGLDFSGRDLVAAEMREASFRGCRFDEATLTEVQASACDFSEASFVRADISGSDLHGAKLRQANLEGALLIDAELIQVDGVAACLDRVRADGAFFEESDWSDATFHAARLSNAELNFACLNRASFADAVLDRIGLREAHGEAVVFDRAVMTAMSMLGARFMRGSFKSIDAETAVFENAELSEADFHGANLHDTSFVRAVCRKTLFVQCTLTEARMTRANLAGGDFRRANLMNATLEGADLTIADLRDCNLHAAGLWKANTQDAQLGGAILTKSSLVMRDP